MNGWKHNFKSLPLPVTINGHPFVVVAVTRRGLALRHVAQPETSAAPTSALDKLPRPMREQPHDLQRAEDERLS